MKESLTTGTTISRYRILTRLGAGGMGEVYKAYDTQLDRSVALKILPADLVQDGDRLRRFIQEARSASALNHPHIVTIYEIGEAQVEAQYQTEGSELKDAGVSTGARSVIHYMAMEFIDGDTLRVKVHREKAELKKLLEYLVQAAEGLAKAHASGIIHRDLKPENIMITQDGYTKVLDFGLAKLVEQKKPESADMEEADTVLMEQRTQPGMVMGTLGYMSPEQVQAKTVDQRSDIFSFGCILYEATTGHKPFEGDSMIDSLHKIVYAQAPPIGEFNPEAPAELQRIIRKCMAKNPDERYQSIKDVALDLRALIREYEMQPLVTGVYPAAQMSGAYPYTGSFPPVSNSQAQGALPAQRPRPGRWIVIASVAAIIVAGLSFLAYKLIGRGTATAVPPFQNFRVTQLTSTGKARSMAVSPDGKYVVHVVDEAGQRSLWVRQVATTSNVQIVQPSEAQYVGMTFSHDGNYIYYVKTEKDQLISELFQVPVLGGAPKKVLVDIDSPISLAPDGRRFVFRRNVPSTKESLLMIANVDGTGEYALATRKAPDFYLTPAWSPDGKVIVSSAGRGGAVNQMGIVEVSLDGGAERVVTAGHWLAAGRPAWMADGSGIVINGVDPTSRLTQVYYVSYPDGNVRRITNDLNSYAGISLTADSRSIAVIKSDSLSNLWVAPSAEAGQAEQVTSGAGKYPNIRWTPDGRIIYSVYTGGSIDLWIMNADGSNPVQLTSGSGVNIYPAVTPDGRYIVFASNRANTANIFNLWRMELNGNNPKQLTDGIGELSPVISPDGKWIVYTSYKGDRSTLWRIPVDGGDPVQLTDKLSGAPAISPDGKYVACIYWDEQLTSQLSAVLIPIEGGPPAKTLNVPAGQLRWSADGSALLYVDNRGGVSNIWSQPLAGGPPRQLTDFKTDLIFDFDVSRDGKTLSLARGVVTTDVVLLTDLRQAEG